MKYKFVVISATEKLLVEVEEKSYHLALQQVISMYPNCEIFTSIKYI